MSPRIPFRLNADGYNRFAELLATVGMRFVEQRREAMPVFGYDPVLVVIQGDLISPHRTYPQCELRSGGGDHEFVFTMRGSDKALLETLRDLEKALAGHLLKR